jgi:predicted O-methyltransferase YrrM
VTGVCELHTIEIFDELEDFLRDVMQRAGDLGRLIHLHFGDALQIIPQLEGPFDVVFIDADKRIYDQYYELVLPLVRTGGLILADNTLWDGKVLNPSPSESDTQTIGLQRFNDLIARDTRVQKVILPMRDGLTLIRRL